MVKPLYGLSWEEVDCCGKLVTIRKIFFTEKERSDFMSEMVRGDVNFYRFVTYSHAKTFAGNVLNEKKNKT